MNAVPIRDHFAVGVDGSPASLAALHWAARAAALHHRPLHVITSLNWPPLAAPSGMSGSWPGQGLAEDGRRAVAETVALARELAPTVPVSGEVVNGSPGAVLADESARAAVVVVGGRGAAGIAGLVPGSVSAYLATHAESPVLVVPPGWDPAAAEHRRIVVGVDGSEVANLAAGFAFEEAATRGVPLVAVRAYPPGTGSKAEAAEAQRLHLARALARWAPAYPQVRIEGRVVAGPAVDGLVAAATGAQLLVVGSRALSGLRGLLVGSVGIRLLHLAECPVAVVHPHHHDQGHRRHRRVAVAAAGG